MTSKVEVHSKSKATFWISVKQVLGLNKIRDQIIVHFSKDMINNAIIERQSSLHFVHPMDRAIN